MGCWLCAHMELPSPPDLGTVARLAAAAATAAASGLACACTFGDAAAGGLPLPQPLRADLTRVWVVGHSGTGKTTTARRMAAKLGALHVDLDELHWLPGWQQRPADEMVAMLEAQLAAAPAGRWVVSGNYTRIVGPVMREAATALVWCCPAFWANQRQLWWRTAARWLQGSRCCNGNVETPANILQLNSESILYYGWWFYDRTARKLQALADEMLGANTNASFSPAAFSNRCMARCAAEEGRIRPQDFLVLRSLADADALVAATGTEG